MRQYPERGVFDLIDLISGLNTMARLTFMIIMEKNISPEHSGGKNGAS
jgi:hypothetical protein